MITAPDDLVVSPFGYMARVGTCLIRAERGGIAPSGMDVSSAPQSNIGDKGEKRWRKIRLESAI